MSATHVRLQATHAVHPTEFDELVVDSFAGGGGASEGIKQALGRDPDIAINHDKFALAMHRVNHRGTRHMLQDVATVDSVGMCAGQPIGMLWMSPDCTDHSKAKGAAPRRDGDATTRGIGWAIVGWVKALPEWQRPRVVFLENVEEYVDWGPLLPDGKRCPKRKGETFKQFVDAWRKLRYTKIEWRERRAWFSGSGTIRKRLFMVMRRDGEDIVWPEPTHGNPNDPVDAIRIAAGELKPWVTVADCLDFSLVCPSIFDSADEIKRKHGIRAKRPLVFNTRARVAKGVKRHVVDAAKLGRAFVVKVNHTGRDEARDRATTVPLSSLTGKCDDALITPVLAGCGGRAAQSPPRAANTPSGTATAKADMCVVSPYLVPRYGERPGQEPRSYPGDRPSPTPVPTGNEGSLAAVSIARQFGNSIESPASAPNGTGTAGGGGKSATVAAFLAQHNTGVVGQDAHRPISTITTGGRFGVAQQALVAASMLTLRGSDRRDAPAAEPARTTSAQGEHNVLISLPLMTVYYGTDDNGAPADMPSRTETAKPRFGLVEALADVPPFSSQHEARARQVAEFLREHDCWDGGEFVTIDIDGVTYVIVDIGMRMLTPRERYNANGFPRDYIIDYGIDADGSEIRFTLEQQGYMCGNAVCPTEAAALVAANYRPRKRQRPGKPPAEAPLFMEAAE